MFDDIDPSMGVFDFDEAGLALLQQALELTLHGELAGQLLQLYRVSAAALEDEEFEFHPLLPDDDVEIAIRTAELGHWCSGFLAGFAQVNQRQTGPDSSEILKDFAAIAEASVDEDADALAATQAHVALRIDVHRRNAVKDIRRIVARVGQVFSDVENAAVQLELHLASLGADFHLLQGDGVRFHDHFTEIDNIARTLNTKIGNDLVFETHVFDNSVVFAGR